MRLLFTFFIFAAVTLNADEKILKQIPQNFNVIAAANCEEIFKNKLPVIMDILRELDDDKLIEISEKNGFNLKLLKKIWFSCNSDSALQKELGDYRWLTFIEFTEDVKLEEFLKIFKDVTKLEILEGKIAELKSYEVNYKMQDIFIIQPNPRLIMLGSKDSLTEALKLNKMTAEENKQNSILANKQITELQASAKENQLWLAAYAKKPQEFDNVSSFVFSLNFNEQLDAKAIINFTTKESCDQIYQSWLMIKGLITNQQDLGLQLKHFQETKFDLSFIMNVSIPVDVLKKIGMLKEEPVEETIESK